MIEPTTEAGKRLLNDELAEPDLYYPDGFLNDAYLRGLARARVIVREKLPGIEAEAMSYAERNMVDMARPEAMAQTAEIERLRAALDDLTQAADRVVTNRETVAYLRPCVWHAYAVLADHARAVLEPTERTICGGMPWPARCRWCDLVTEDPDGFFCPSDSDVEVVGEPYRCPGSPTGLHEPMEPTDER